MMLSLQAIAIAIQMSHALLSPVPMAQQDVPLITDHDTLLRRQFHTSYGPIGPSFMFQKWNTSSHKEKVA